MYLYLSWVFYCKYLGQLTWVPQKLSFTVSTLLSWKLQWDRSDLSHSMVRDVISMGQSPEIQPERGNVPGLWLIFLLYQKRIHDLKSQYHISIILQHFRKILRRDDVKPGFGKWLQFGRNLYRNDMWWWRPWMQILACQKHVESRSSKELISIPSHFHSGNSQTVSNTSFNKLAPCKMSSIAGLSQFVDLQRTSEKSLTSCKRVKPGFAGMKCSGHLPVTENHSHLQSLQ